MNSNIPTAEEFKNKEYSNVYWDENTAMEFAIEFAKLHVEAALKEANKKAIMTGYIDSGQTILNAYPLTLIK